MSHPLTLGTAGHVDHGKTSLVERLTGKNTDRLAEERERGLSIDLGFAPLTLPDGRQLSVVDVPGHERFVRTMVAGATGIDLYVLCIAADDGVMPQTREHAVILRQLGVDPGVVAITKVDRSDPARATAEANELVPDAPTVAASARTGYGIVELLSALEDLTASIRPKGVSTAPARLHVDRCFSLHGIGTVVTGTLWSGSIQPGDTVTCQPSGLSTRVRSIQVHDMQVDQAECGQRVALALAGARRDAVQRGDVICSPDADLRPTYRVDATISLEPGAAPLPTRVQVHHGTRDSSARVVPLGSEPTQHGSRYNVQLRLERPFVTVPGDRLIFRRLAPPETIGGGAVLNPHPSRHQTTAYEIDQSPAIGRAGACEPLGPPSSRSAEAALSPAAERLLEALRADDEAPRTDAALLETVGLGAAEGKRYLRELVDAGSAVRVGSNQHFYAPILVELSERALAICRRKGELTIAGLRDELGTSRKYAQAVLEHLGRTHQTRRLGDHHVPRQRSWTGSASGEGIEPSKRGAAPPSQF